MAGIQGPGIGNQGSGTRDRGPGTGAGAFAILLFVLLAGGPSLAQSKIMKGASESKHHAFRDVTGFVFKKGLFISGDIGVYFAKGGYRESASCIRCEPRSFSLAEPFIAATVGYDVIENLALGLQLSSGYVSNAARLKGEQESPTDFGLHFINGIVIGSLPVWGRLWGEGTVFAGLALMNPPALPKKKNYGFNAGIGLGLRYDTLLADMVIGLDVKANYAMIPMASQSDAPGIFGLSVSPVIKYVF